MQVSLLSKFCNVSLYSLDKEKNYEKELLPLSLQNCPEPNLYLGKTGNGIAAAENCPLAVYLLLHVDFLFYFINLFIYLFFIFGCVGSSLLCTGFL